MSELPVVHTNGAMAPSLTVACPTCHAPLEIAAAIATFKCPSCGTKFRVATGDFTRGGSR